MRKFFVLIAFLLISITVAAQDSTTYYVSVRTANVRACSLTTCAIVAKLPSGTAIQPLEQVEGAKVSGSTIWYRIDVNGKEGYIHASLVTTKAPKASAPATGSSVQATAVPALISTPAPAAPAFACSCSKTCEAMASCEEAYYQLNQCGCGKRDSDHDGVPCESICPGG